MNNEYEPEEDDEFLIELVTKNGETVKFFEIAGIAYRGKYYAILQPVELLDGMSNDEALVFRLTTDKSGKNHYELENNDSIIDAVFEEYYRLLDKTEKKDNNSLIKQSLNKHPWRKDPPKKTKKNKQNWGGIILALLPLLIAVFAFIFAKSFPFLLVPVGVGCIIWFIIALVRFLRKRRKRK